MVESMIHLFTAPLNKICISIKARSIWYAYLISPKSVKQIFEHENYINNNFYFKSIFYFHNNFSFKSIYVGVLESFSVSVFAKSQTKDKEAARRCL